MIRVTVELVSARGRAHDRVLGVANIGNDGTGTATFGHYDAALFGRSKAVWRRVRVRRFPRRRLLAWDLLYRVLREACKERNP